MSDAKQDSLKHTDVGEPASQPIPADHETGNAELTSESQGTLVRDELLSKGRLFLTSPSVQSQDVDAKRTFLKEKGLSEHDIEDLLRTSVRTTFSINHGSF